MRAHERDMMMRTREWDFDPVNDPFDEAATEQFDRAAAPAAHMEGDGR